MSGITVGLFRKTKLRNQSNGPVNKICVIKLGYNSYITHIIIAMITITQMSDAEATPPKKSPISADGDVVVCVVAMHCSLPLLINNSTPSTKTVAFSDDIWEFMRLMRSVAVREPSSEE